MVNLRLVAELAKKGLTAEERLILKAVALELLEIRRVVDALAETMAKLSEKELLKAFGAGHDGLEEKKVERQRMKLDSELDAVERDLGL